jgi:hypothetical protein
MMRTLVTVAVLASSISLFAQIGWQQFYGLGQVQQVKEVSDGYHLIVKDNQTYHFVQIDILGQLQASQQLHYQADAVYLGSDSLFTAVNIAQRKVIKFNTLGQQIWQWEKTDLTNFHSFYAAQLPSGVIVATTIRKSPQAPNPYTIFTIEMDWIDLEGQVIASNSHMDYFRPNTLMVQEYQYDSDISIIAIFKPSWSGFYGDLIEWAGRWSMFGFQKKLDIPFEQYCPLNYLKVKKVVRNPALNRLWFVLDEVCINTGGHGFNASRQYLSCRTEVPNKEIYRKDYQQSYVGIYHLYWTISFRYFGKTRQFPCFAILF